MAGMTRSNREEIAEWRYVGDKLALDWPDFPIASEVAHRIADAKEARLPMGWESVPLIDGDDLEVVTDRRER